jgi:small conductance mechanosensitive channel
MDESQATGAIAAGTNGGQPSEGLLGLPIDEKTVSLIQEYAIPVLGAIVLLVVGWIVAKWVSHITRKGLTRAKVDETLVKFFANLSKWAVLIFVLLACFKIVGVELVAFVGVIAASAFAIGLAFQGSLSNFAAGVMLLVFRPFRVGDFVSVAGQTGKIDEIGLFTTTMDTPDNRRLILPNGSIFGATIENITHHKIRRVDVAVGTEYSADLDQTRAVLLEAARAVPGQVADKEPAVMLSELGGSSVDWSVRVWVATSDYWPTRDALTKSVKVHLDGAGIGIPFPQMDVHMETATVPAGA